MGKAFVLFILLSSGAFAAAAGIEYYDQDIHEHILFGDSWRGAYVKSFINRDWNRVRFEYCGTEYVGGYHTSSCKQLVKREMHKEELPYFTAGLLRRLRALRAEVVSGLDRNFIMRYLTQRHDLEALDAVIASLENEGLENWVLLREDPKLPPRFETQKLTDKVALAFTETMKDPAPVQQAPTPAPQAPPEKAPSAAATVSGTLISR
jgi:hypothetical protein